MKFQQLLIAAMALGVCTGMPVKPEPRKFVYQDGSPSVRRYPVYPDRLSNEISNVDEMDNATEKNIKNVSTIKPDRNPLGTEKEEEKEMSTESLVRTENELTAAATTSTSRPTTPPTTPPSFFGELNTEGTFATPLSFTPQPSVFPSESSISSSSPVSTDFASPVLSIFGPGPTIPVDPAFPSESSFEALNHNTNSNSVFPLPQTTPEEVFPPGEADASLTAFTGDLIEETTDTPTTTDFPVSEEEERMVIETEVPQEVDAEAEVEAEVEVEAALPTSDATLLEEPATESSWDPVTQEVYTTEEIEAF